LSIPEFNFKKPTKMKCNPLIIIGCLLLFSASCHHTHRHAADEHEHACVSGVDCPEESGKHKDYGIEAVRTEAFGPVIRATAQILPAQGDEQVVVARTNGIVHFPDNELVDGKAVGAGQHLFFIESAGLADDNLRVRYATAESEYIRAKAEYERKNELAREQIVSESERMQAQTTFVQAESEFNNLRKNFSGGRQALIAPLTGYITRLPVRNGEYVEAGQAVLTVSQNRNLLIRAEIQPKFSDRLDHITAAAFRILNSETVFSLEELQGKVLSFGRTTGTDSPFLPVIFQVRNNGRLLPGSFVEVYIQTLTNRQALTVPNSAILEEMGNYVVFVQKDSGELEKRLIHKGDTDGFRTEIREGVAAGEQVVTQGAMEVKLAQATGQLDAHGGHVH
jgi:RND family efflux transporter MFP subunit